mgnify:CR=1 FL=1
MAKEQFEAAAKALWLETLALAKALHRKACGVEVASSYPRNTYIDPDTGYSVFTAAYLKRRPCCGNGCRHCPWGHANVPGNTQNKKNKNSTRNTGNGKGNDDNESENESDSDSDSDSDDDDDEEEEEHEEEESDDEERNRLAKQLEW